MIRMTSKRFKRYLLDGGFSFGEEYVPPKWSISDENTKGSPFGFLEFDDEHKDLCDEIVDSLNEFVDEYNHLKEENEKLKEQLSEAKTDEKQLGISFMGYKMKLIEVLQKKYDKVKGKTLYADVYTEIAEEMGVDLE